MFFIPGQSRYLSRTIRLALGITFGLGVGQIANWQLSYLMPIFMSMLLAGPPIDVKKGIGFVVVILIGTMLGMLLTTSVVQLPFVCLLVISLLMFHIFYAGNKGMSPLLVVMLLMGITAIPLVGVQSSGLAFIVVKGLLTSGIVAVIFTILLFWLIPEVTEQDQPPAKTEVEKPLQSAVISTLVMLPLVIVFYTFSLTGAILTFVFAAILAQTPDLTSGLRSSAGLMVANALGGVIAIVIYNLLVIVPEFVFLLLLIFIVSLLFAEKIFSDDPYAALYSTAFTAVLLLIGSSMGIVSGSAASNFMARIVQIMAAAAYIVLAFYIISRLSGYRARVNGEVGNQTESALITDSV